MSHEQLFRNPTNQYRAIPFWAWNCRLDETELLRQMDIFKEMGMGGVMIHARDGLDTPYMSPEFMEKVQACVQKAKSEGSFVWLYDEDRWPSGDAGRQVTQNPTYRIRVVKMTAVSEPVLPQAEAIACGGTYLLGMYALKRNQDGALQAYRRISLDDVCDSDETMVYAYCQCVPNYYYVDTLSKEAIERFVALTHEKYLALCGDDFGATIPSVFTDEPQFAKKEWLDSGTDTGPVCMPWTKDLPETYARCYGTDILDTLPELFWDREDGETALARYRYHNHVTDRFIEAFLETISAWCQQHNIKLSGHMMAEQALWTQSAWVGDAMRCYGAFQIPGVDMLCDWREYTTVLQARSAVHQYGRKELLSEMYGVTNWDFDFRGHKMQGDWQAALGVTLRVPHLAWVSMHGDAKRDYPASIGYQSPWYSQYALVEDHFARLNTVLTRGEPMVNIAVVHPVESYWLYWGPKDRNGVTQQNLENHLQAITNWLLFGGLDFDFICEDKLPSLYQVTDAGLQVGAMTYQTVVICGCVTLRESTVDILMDFIGKGGQVWFVGNPPTRISGKVDNDALMELHRCAQKIEMKRDTLLETLRPYAQVELVHASGRPADHLLCQLRKDTDCHWLFVAHGQSMDNRDCADAESLVIRVKGCFTPELYQTESGEIQTLPCTYTYKEETVWTEISAIMYGQDSLLLRLNPCAIVQERSDAYDPLPLPGTLLSTVCLQDQYPFVPSEPNVFVLDTAVYAIDNQPASCEAEEMLRIDECLHKTLWPDRGDWCAMQPYMMPNEPYVHTIHLRFTFESEIDVADCCLAVEDAERVTVSLNGMFVPTVVQGYFTDRAIQTIQLPRLTKGNNVLELRIPVNYKSRIEWCYLLGDFGVRVEGSRKIITKKPTCLAFDSLTKQQYPFYGANITYETTFDVPDDCDKSDAFTVRIRIPCYRGAMVTAVVDGQHKGNIIYAPYCMQLSGLAAGKHTLSLTCYGNRYNSFGPLHLCDESRIWFGPDAWHTQGNEWTYDYKLKETGFLQAPVIEIYSDSCYNSN